MDCCGRCLFTLTGMDLSETGSCLVCSALDGSPTERGRIGFALLPKTSQAFAAGAFRVEAVQSLLSSLPGASAPLSLRAGTRLGSWTSAIRSFADRFDRQVPDRNALAKALRSADGETLRRDLRTFPRFLPREEVLSWLDYQSSFSHLTESL